MHSVKSDRRFVRYAPARLTSLSCALCFPLRRWWPSLNPLLQAAGRQASGRQLLVRTGWATLPRITRLSNGLENAAAAAALLELLPHTPLLLEASAPASPPWLLDREPDWTGEGGLTQQCCRRAGREGLQLVRAGGAGDLRCIRRRCGCNALRSPHALQLLPHTAGPSTALLLSATRYQLPASTAVCAPERGYPAI